MSDGVAVFIFGLLAVGYRRSAGNRFAWGRRKSRPSSGNSRVFSGVKIRACKIHSGSVGESSHSLPGFFFLCLPRLLSTSCSRLR